MSSFKTCSAILFGPQLVDLKADKLSRIREVLSSNPLLRDLYQAFLKFEDFGEQLQASSPELQSIGVREKSLLLSKWMNGNDAAVLELLEGHSNAIAGPITVIDQILLLVQHLNGSPSVQPQVSLRPETTFEGLCIGKLAATAAKLSLGGERLAKLSCIAMRLAFCIGAYVDLDQHLAGDANEATCLAVTCRDGSDEPQQIKEFLNGFDTAYISIRQKSKATITVAKMQAPALTQKLNAKGYKVKAFNLFGRFHCSEMSWAVQKILQLAKCQPDLRLVSHHALRPILASILTLPQDWLLSLPQPVESSELGPTPYLLLVGEGVMSPKSTQNLGFQVRATDVLKTYSTAQEGRDSYQGSLSQINSLMPDSSPSLPYPDSAVAVIGVACKFAGADSLDQLWKVLETGTTMYRNLPEDRFPDSRFERRSYPKNFKCNIIDDVDGFDHKFFNVSSREALFMDPQQRLALQVTYQALESAGYFNRDNLETNRDIGCYLGICTAEYHENVATHTPSAFSLTGSIRPFVGGKVNHHFGWTGPAIMYDTACAASGTAIHQACRAIATGECSEAIAGGVNVFVSPDTFQNLAGGHFISSTGASKSFDAAGDGYCRGEGVAIVMLKKLSAALRDGDLIRGVIASTSVGQNANKTSITVPHGPSQMNLYRKALQAACLDAQEISYVEAHGTGTPVGDPIEANSIRQVFGSQSRQYNEKTYLGSLKSNIGHTEASSGVSGLIKVLLMMEKGVIPQQALFNKLNPAIDPLGPDGIEIPTKNVPWDAEFKAACVNNYGASGTNAVMVVTQRPDAHSSLGKDLASLPPNATFPISISAFSPSSLVAYCSALLEFIDQSPLSINDRTADMAYHLSRRRNPSLPYSLCTTVSSLHELRDLCISAISKEYPKEEKAQRPVILLFGGQTGNMASVPQVLYDSSAIFRKHLQDCDTALQALGSPSIFPTIFERGPHDDVVILHSILFSAQYASAMSWLDCGLRPARLIGHSFGQLTALCVSGVLSLSDSLKLITTRARLVRDHWGKDSGSMIAIEADFAAVSKLLTQHANLDLEIACHNGPQSFVLAGSTPSVDALETLLQSSPQRLRCKRLEVTNAFHSSLSEPLIGALLETAERLDFKPARFPLETCSRTNSWPRVTPTLVASHTRDPVYFNQAVERISDQLGSCVWLEVGSESGIPMLRRALGKRASSHSLYSTSPDIGPSLKPLAEVTANLWRLGLSVQYWPFHQSQQHQYGMLNLPPYQFDKFRHWLEWKELSPPAIEVQRPLLVQSTLLSLMRQTKNGASFQINTECEMWKDMCSEHRVLGLSICPLSSLLDVVSKALDTISDASKRQTDAYNVQYLGMQRPIPAKHETGLALTIAYGDEPGSWSFKLTDAPGSTSTYVSGTISVSARSEGHLQDFTHFQSLLATTHIKSLTTDAEADSVKGKAVYNSLAPLFQIPRPGQRIKQVSAKGDEATAYLMISSDNSFMAIEDLIQVPLVCLNGLRDRNDDDMYINTAIGSARFKNSFYSSVDGSAYCAAYLKFGQLRGVETTCDIFVFDLQNEQLFATILDAKFTKEKPEVLRQALDNIFPPPQLTVSSCPAPPKVLEHADTSDDQQRQHPPLSSNDCVSPRSAGLPDLAQALFELLGRVADVDTDALRSNLPIPDLGIDSLMAIEVAEEINKSFSINIDTAEFAAVDDVVSLCRLIADRTTDYAFDEEASLRTPPETEPTSNEEVSRMGSPTALPTDSRHGSLDKAFRAFDIIRGDFDIFAKATGCDQFWSEVYPTQASLVVAYIVEAFAKLGCDLSRIDEGEEIQTPQSPKDKKLIRQLMRALRDDGYVTEAADGVWIRTKKTVSFEPSSAEQFNQILASFPQFAPDHELLHSVGSKLDECLSGKLNPVPLLFGSPEKRKVMADLYLISPIQYSVSQQLGRFVEKCFGSQAIQEPIRVLEIGGGTCGTTLHAVAAFAKLGIPVKYTFSDISSSFISAAKAKLSEYKFVSYRTLDVTETPGPDLQSHFDIIISTNTIHATPNACRSASNVRQMLRPGGFFTLVEYTCNMYLLDVVFGQLDGWWLHDDGRDHAIMDVEAWKKTLELAGFERVDWTEGQSEESKIVSILLAA